MTEVSDLKSEITTLQAANAETQVDPKREREAERCHDLLDNFDSVKDELVHAIESYQDQQRA